MLSSISCLVADVLTLQDQTFYDKLDEPDDDENDMLDLAFGLTETWVYHHWCINYVYEGGKAVFKSLSTERSH